MEDLPSPLGDLVDTDSQVIIRDFRSVMDLTPKNHCWWPMFNCCRPPTVPTSSDDAEQDTDEYFHNEYLFSISPPLKITTTSGKDGVGDEVAVNLDTPTTACTDRSAGENTMYLWYCMPFTHWLRSVNLLISLFSL